MDFTYDGLTLLMERHPAWRLLRADSAPFVLSVLHAAFSADGARSLPERELMGRLEDSQFQVRADFNPDAFPKQPREYLNDWAHPERAWLRKYYPPDSDEPHYDLTPATDKILTWLESLAERTFVGTESRLLTVIELLRQMAEGATADPHERIAVLEQRRAEIDSEIERVQRGEVDLLDAAALRDRFQQVSATARGLLADFREVAANFRRLDRDIRERIAAWDGPRGELLDRVFGEQEVIGDSDQGRSFQAFWDLLMSADRQEEFEQLLEQVLALPAVRGADPGMRYIQSDWLKAGDSVQQTVAQLSHQLRRFLDDQAYLDNRRVAELVRRIEGHALMLRDTPPQHPFDLPGAQAEIKLPMARRLYESATSAPLVQVDVSAGNPDFAVDSLFDQSAVDPLMLRRRVKSALRNADQVTLSEIVTSDPLEDGLAEVVAYLSIADEEPAAMFDPEQEEVLTWVGTDGTERSVSGPTVVFTKDGESE